jgi:hypothetical protein
MNTPLVTVKDKIKEISTKLNNLVDQTNNILNISSDFGHRFVDSSDKLVNEYKLNNPNINYDINDNDASFSEKNLEFQINFNTITDEVLQPFISKDVSILYDFNLALASFTDLQSYENLVSITIKLNKNLTNLLTLFVEKMDPYFTQYYIKFVNENCVFRQQNNILISEISITSKPIYCPGFTWDILNILNVINQNCSNSKLFLENKKRYLTENKFQKTGNLYESFWQNLTLNKVNGYLNSYFSIISLESCKKYYRSLIDDLKYLKSYINFMKNTENSLTYLHDDDILKEFEFLSTNLDNLYSPELEINQFSDIHVIPISQLKKEFDITSGKTGQGESLKTINLNQPRSQINEDQMKDQKTNPRQPKGKGGYKKQKLSPISLAEKNINYISQHPNMFDVTMRSQKSNNRHDIEHRKKHKELKPVNNKGEYIIHSSDDPIDIETHSKIISDLFSPFERLVNNENFNIFTSDYNYFQNYDFEEQTFSKFVEKISNFETYWNLIANVFNDDSIKFFNDNFLNSMCYDLTKSVFVTAHAIILKTELQNNKPNDPDYQTSYTLKNIIDNNPQLFPKAFSIRDVALISSYLAEYYNNNSLQMCSIANEHIPDSILLAPHIQMLIVYCYGYFIKYLKYMAQLNNEHTVTGDTKSYESKFHCKNIYLFCLRLLSNSSNITEFSLSNEGEVTLVIFILNKFMDFIYRSLKINRICTSQQTLTNLSPEIEQQLKSSGHFVIEDSDGFFKYLSDFIKLAKQKINSTCLHIFNYTSISHENSILFLSKFQLRYLAQLCLNKLTVYDLVKKPNVNFNNLNKNILIFLYSNFKEKNADKLPANEELITGDNLLSFGEHSSESVPGLDVYNALPNLDSYIKYYKNLKHEVGKDFLKFNLDKTNKYFIQTTQPYRTQFTQVPNLDISKYKLKIDTIEESGKENLFSSLYNIELTNNLLENLNNYSFVISTKISKLIETVFDQKSFLLIHYLALLNFHKYKTHYILNNLDWAAKGSDIQFSTYLGGGLLDDSCMYINIKILLKQLESNEKIVKFFETNTYLKNFKFFLQKTFSTTFEITCVDYFLNILRPIQLTRNENNFYLGIFILYIWHIIFNNSII